MVEVRDEHVGWVREHRQLATLAAAVLVVVGLVAAVGGLRDQPSLGRQIRLSDSVDVGRFTVHVDRVEVANSSVGSDYPMDPKKYPPTFRIWATVTNTTDTSIGVSTFENLTCVVPGGTAPDDSDSARTAEWHVDNLDPDVPTPVYVEQSWLGGQRGDPMPAALTVILHKDVKNDRFLGNDNDPPLPGPATAHLSVPVVDHRLPPEKAS